MNLENLTVPKHEARVMPQDDGTFRVVIAHHYPPHHIWEPGVNVQSSTTLPETFITAAEALAHGQKFLDKGECPQKLAREHCAKMEKGKG